MLRALRVALSVLLVACTGDPEPPVPSTAATSTTVSAPLPSSASLPAPSPVASASTRPPPPPASASWPLPDAPPPDEAAWANAQPANNIAPEAMRSSKCALKRISQWFRIECKGLIRGANMGTFNRDYFTKSEAAGNTLTLRARPGEIVSADVAGEPPTFIHIGWASDDAEPGFAMMVHSLQRDVWYIMSREPGPIPIAVGAPTPQPREADFLKGANVNTTDKVRRYPKCTTRMLRDWLLVSCEATFANLVGAGTPGKDYFIRPGIMQPTLVILPLREGMDVESAMTPGGMFRVKWPAGERAPTRIETEKVE